MIKQPIGWGEPNLGVLFSSVRVGFKFLSLAVTQCRVPSVWPYSMWLWKRISRVMRCVWGNTWPICWKSRNWSIHWSVMSGKQTHSDSMWHNWSVLCMSCKADPEHCYYIWLNAQFMLCLYVHQWLTMKHFGISCSDTFALSSDCQLNIVGDPVIYLPWTHSCHNIITNHYWKFENFLKDNVMKSGTF